MSRLRERVDAAVADERRQALRLLLQRPLLVRGRDREAVTLVRRHETWLRAWFDEQAGWSLQRDGESIRLRKWPSRLLPAPASHPAQDLRLQRPFSRRRYVCLCLALAACERAGRQITLQHLAEEIQAQLLGDPVLVAAGVVLDLEQRPDRGDLVAVGRWLLDHAVLERVHGDEERFLAGSGDCLYSIHRAVLGRLLAVRQGPSLIAADSWSERLAALQQELGGDGGPARRRELRRQLIRALLQHPVLYYADLDEEAAAYLRSQQSHLVEELCAATGLVAEQRREGIALVDEEGEMTDFRLPSEGTDGHAALLLAEHLAASLREDPTGVLPVAGIDRFLAGCAREYVRLWRRDVASAEGCRRLREILLTRLQALGLVRCSEDGVRPLPAIARYGLAAALEAEPDAAAGAVQGTLFATEPAL